MVSRRVRFCGDAALYPAQGVDQQWATRGAGAKRQPSTDRGLSSGTVMCSKNFSARAFLSGFQHVQRETVRLAHGPRRRASCAAKP